VISTRKRVATPVPADLATHHEYIMEKRDAARFYLSYLIDPVVPVVLGIVLPTGPRHYDLIPEPELKLPAMSGDREATAARALRKWRQVESSVRWTPQSPLR